MNQISIAIVSYEDQVEPLQGLLSDLLRQTEQQRIKEILILDNGCAPEVCKAICRDFGTRIDWIPTDENNIGRARQMAVTLATSDWIVFVDSDCRVGSDWLAALIAAAEPFASKQDFAGLAGPNQMPESHPLGQIINEMTHNPLGHGRSPQAEKAASLRKATHLPTTNALLRRSAVLAAHNFSDKCQRGGEDLNLGWRLQRAGFELHLAPAPVVTNLCCETWHEWAYRMFRFGRLQWTCLDRQTELRLQPHSSTLMLLSISWLACLLIAPQTAAAASAAYLIGIFGSTFFYRIDQRVSRLSLSALIVVTHAAYAAGLLIGPFEWLAARLSEIQRTRFSLKSGDNI